jgi:hypothetical protein
VRRVLVALTLPLLLLPACDDDTGSEASAAPATPVPTAAVLAGAEPVRVAVVEAPALEDMPNFERADVYLTAPLLIDTGTGPRACWSWGDSYPPFCDGVPVSGVTHDDVTSIEEGAGAWWTAEPYPWMRVEPDGAGLRWLGWADDADVARLVEPLRREYGDETTVPCDPPGGWVSLDGVRLSKDDYIDALIVLGDDPAVIDSWNGRLVDLPEFPADAAGQDEWFALADSPANDVLTLRSATPEVTAAKAADVWDGLVCVVGPVPGVDPDVDVLAAVHELRPDRQIGGSRDTKTGRWLLVSTYPEPELAAELDERFGPGTAEIVPSLLPADPPG